MLYFHRRPSVTSLACQITILVQYLTTSMYGVNIGRRITFHIKLDSHDVIYSNGAPVETLLNVDERAVNFAEYFRKDGAPKAQKKLWRPLLAGVRQAGLPE